MEEAPENGKESSHFAHVDRMNEMNSHLITDAFLLFVRSQFTINAKYFLYVNQCTSLLIWGIQISDKFELGWLMVSSRHFICADFLHVLYLLLGYI